MTNQSTRSPLKNFEEVYLGYEIFVEPNHDQYRGGFAWSICRDGVELEVGLDFSAENAIQKARDAVGVLNQANNLQ
jgi:hypothetical protein